jgi:hypothetical protein
MPIQNDQWPVNRYIVPQARLDADPAWARRPGIPAEQPDAVHFTVAQPSATGPAATNATTLAPSNIDWSWNRLAFSADAPSNGWISVRQIDDPGWRVTVDGHRVDQVKANDASMAVPVSAGAHHVVLSFEPLSRRLYWPAAIMLQLAVVTLLVGAVRSRRRPT